MANNFIIDSAKLMANLHYYTSPIAFKMYAETKAKELEGYAKQNRPWTDRTGDARKRLSGYVKDIPNGYRIILAHGVDYGMWLELAMEKRFAILEPTIRLKGPDIVKGMKDLFKKI